jgi:Flp pilus assembly pilin Flp
MRIAPIVRQFVQEEDGIAVTEYGLLIALVAVALVAVVQTFGTSIRAWFSGATNKVTAAQPG